MEHWNLTKEVIKKNIKKLEHIHHFIYEHFLYRDMYDAYVAAQEALSCHNSVSPLNPKYPERANTLFIDNKPMEQTPPIRLLAEERVLTGMIVTLDGILTFMEELECQREVDEDMKNLFRPEEWGTYWVDDKQTPIDQD